MKFSNVIFVNLIAILVLTGTGGYFVLNATQEVLKEEIGLNSIIISHHLMDDIDRNIQSRIENAHLYSHSPLVIQKIVESNQEFEKLGSIDDYINEKDMEWISESNKEITPFMYELINNELAEELKKQIEFYEKQYGYKIIDEIVITNKYGANIAQSGKTSDYEQSDEEWWQSAKREGIFVSDVKYDESAGSFSIDIGVRTEDSNNNFIGIIKFILNIQETNTIIMENISQKHAQHKTMEIYLINKEGKIIYSRNNYTIFEDLSNEEFYKNLTKNNDYFSIDYMGKRKLVSYAHSKGHREFDGLNWTLIIFYDEEEILKPINQLKNFILITVISMLIIGVILILILYSAITKPIKKITNTIEEISKGNFDVSLEKSNIVEINSLIESLNRIMTSMKRAVKRLDIKKEDTNKRLIKKDGDEEENE